MALHKWFSSLLHNSSYGDREKANCAFHFELILKNRSSLFHTNVMAIDWISIFPFPPDILIGISRIVRKEEKKQQQQQQPENAHTQFIYMVMSLYFDKCIDWIPW